MDEALEYDGLKGSVIKKNAAGEWTTLGLPLRTALLMFWIWDCCVAGLSRTGSTVDD